MGFFNGFKTESAGFVYGEFFRRIHSLACFVFCRWTVFSIYSQKPGLGTKILVFRAVSTHTDDGLYGFKDWPWQGEALDVAE